MDIKVEKTKEDKLHERKERDIKGRERKKTAIEKINGCRKRK